MERGSEDPFAALFTGSITAKIAGSIKAIIDTCRQVWVTGYGKGVQSIAADADKPRR